MRSSILSTASDRPPNAGKNTWIYPLVWGISIGYVYVVQGPRIYEFTPGGTLVGLFASVPTAGGDHSGITFDREGAFGNKMIITASTGHAYTVDSSGSVTLLANVAAFHENPEVIPVGFGPLGGQIWTAAENADKVFAISPSGVATVVGASSTFFDGAETVHLIPDSVCNFGQSGGAFFVTDTFNASLGGHVVKYPASDFTALGSNVLVAGEHGNPIAIISATGAGYAFSIFDSTTRHHEGATFTRCISVPTNEPPVADAGGPYDVDEGSSVTVTSAGSTDADGVGVTDIVSRNWDLDNDSNFDDASGVTASFTTGDDGLATATSPYASVTPRAPATTTRLRSRSITLRPSSTRTFRWSRPSTRAASRR